MQEVVGSNPIEGKICFSHFTLLEWNVKNCFVKLIKTLKINKKNYFVWNDDIYLICNILMHCDLFYAILYVCLQYFTDDILLKIIFQRTFRLISLFVYYVARQFSLSQDGPLAKSKAPQLVNPWYYLKYCLFLNQSVTRTLNFGSLRTLHYLALLSFNCLAFLIKIY